MLRRRPGQNPPDALKGRGVALGHCQLLGGMLRRRNVAINTSGGHPDMDYNEHTRTYAGFLRAIKIGVVLLVLLLIGMKLFLV